MAEVVELDDDAVYLVIEIVAPRGPAPLVGDHLLDTRRYDDTFGDPETPLRQRLDTLSVLADGDTSDGEHVERHEMQLALGCHTGIKLADRARRRVPWRGVWLDSGLDHPCVYRLEVGDIHEHLAPDSQQFGCRAIGLSQSQRHGRDCSGVLGNTLALGAVATRNRTYEPPTLVDQSDGSTVELGLEQVFHMPLHTLANALVEATHVVLTVRRVEREHRSGVKEGRELRLRFTAYTLGRRVPGDEVGIRFLDSLKPPEEMIVVLVREFGARLNVVEVVVVADLGTKPLDLVGGFSGGEATRGHLHLGSALRSCAGSGGIAVFNQLAYPLDEQEIPEFRAHLAARRDGSAFLRPHRSTIQAALYSAGTLQTFFPAWLPAQLRVRLDGVQLLRANALPLVIRPTPRATLALCWASTACISAPGAATPAPPIDPLAALEEAPLGGAQWSALAVDLTTGDTLLAGNPGRRMIPGSTIKLFTAVAALDLLGPEFRWETGLWATTPADPAVASDTMVAGDLVVTASGDPTWSARFAGSVAAPLERAAIALESIRRVTGALVVDASSWDSTSVRPSWMVEDLASPAGASGGAFALMEGQTHIEIGGGVAPGDSVSVRWWPLGENDFVRSRLVTTAVGARDVRATWLPESRVLELAGVVPAGVVDTLRLPTRDPVRQAASALYRAVIEHGISVDAGWRVAWDTGEPVAGGCVSGSVSACTAARRVGSLMSLPLLDVVAAMLEPSQNWIAEQVVRTVGYTRSNRASWTEGLDAVRGYAGALPSVDSMDIRIADGSGLSVQNLVTARALVAVLTHARSRPWGEAFRAALAEPGEEGSTLEARLSELQGRLFAKTGTLTNVGALAGYLINQAGREIAFAILVNSSNLPGSTVRSAIDDVLRALAGQW